MHQYYLQRLFPAIKDVTYLNSCSYALGNIKAQKAIETITNEWVNGQFDFMKAESYGEIARDYFANFIGVDKHEIAMTSFLSNASGLIANQLSPTVDKNIVVAECEFASNYYPWVQLKNKGYEIRLVKPHNGILDLEDFNKLIDKHTSLVAISAVQSSSGFKIDLKSLAQIAHKNQALIFVDASQALCAVPLNAKELEIDILASVSYKFLLGVRGQTYMYIKDELIDKFKPMTPGWRAGKNPMKSFYGPRVEYALGASKLDTSLSWFPVAGELASFELINEIGLENIYKKNQTLIEYTIQSFEDHNIDYQKYPEENCSTIFIIPVKDEEKIKNRLFDNNIEASFRQGKLRIGMHFYNEKEDIDRVCQLLK